MSVKVCHGEILEKDCLMPRIAGSPCPTDTERDVEDFLADMRELVAGSLTGPTFRKGDAPGRHGPAVLCSAGYEQDRLIYQRAAGMGFGVAGMVASSADRLVE